MLFGVLVTVYSHRSTSKDCNAQLSINLGRNRAGEEVKAGQGLIILSAMKMETSVAAPCTGSNFQNKTSGQWCCSITVVPLGGQKQVQALSLHCRSRSPFFPRYVAEAPSSTR